MTTSLCKKCKEAAKKNLLMAGPLRPKPSPPLELNGR